MAKHNYTSHITTSIAPKKASEMISRVAAWWAENLEGNSRQVDDIFTVRFGETFVTFRVIEIIKDRKIRWQVTDCDLHWLADRKEWKGTEILWEISTEDEQTHVRFTHVGLIPEIECYKDCVKGWNFYIQESLFKLLTQGKGLPEKKKVNS